MTTAAPVRETANPYLNGNYAPVREEVTAIDLDVTGAIPKYLDGRYLRIGPNPVGDPDPGTDRLVHFVRQPISATLSAREVEVLNHVAKGNTNAEIGHQLHISEATVKTHLLRAFNKLGVSDRTAAVTTAMSLGLLSS